MQSQLRDLDNLAPNTVPDFFHETGIQVQFLNLRSVHAHIHKNIIELVYCISGTICCHNAHEVFTLHAGDLMCFEQNDLRFLMAEKDNLTLIIHIDLHSVSDPIEDYLHTLIVCNSVEKDISNPQSLLELSSQMLTIAYVYAQYAECPDVKATDQQLSSLGTSLVSYLHDKFSWFRILDNDRQTHAYDDRFRKVVEYITQLQYDSFHNLSTNQIAETLHLNPSYLTSFMRRTSVRSLNNLVSYYKCLVAQLLLLQTSLSITEIAENSGFSSDKYLFQYFKKYFGCTPHQYRKEFRQYHKMGDSFETISSSEMIPIIMRELAELTVRRYCDHCQQ